VWRVQDRNLERFMAATSLLALLDDIASIVQWIAAISEMGAYLAMLAPSIVNGLVGLVVGAVRCWWRLAMYLGD